MKHSTILSAVLLSSVVSANTMAACDSPGRWHAYIGANHCSLWIYDTGYISRAHSSCQNFETGMGLDVTGGRIRVDKYCKLYGNLEIEGINLVMRHGQMSKDKTVASGVFSDGAVAVTFQAIKR